MTATNISKTNESLDLILECTVFIGEGGRGMKKKKVLVAFLSVFLCVSVPKDRRSDLKKTENVSEVHKKLLLYESPSLSDLSI